MPEKLIELAEEAIIDAAAEAQEGGEYEPVEWANIVVSMLSTTPQPEGDGWIFTRPPEFPEGDWHSEVWALARDGAIELLGVNEVITDWKANDGKGLIAWMRTGLKEPQPPAEGED